MSAIFVLILRILVVITLYAFLGWALYTIWRSIQASTQLFNANQIPPILFTLLDSEHEIQQEFDSKDVLIGRDPACEFSVLNDMVSSRHARLSFHHKQWWIEDLNSTNGTFLNDERVSTPTVIISGDELRLGNIVFQISIRTNHS